MPCAPPKAGAVLRPGRGGGRPGRRRDAVRRRLTEFTNALAAQLPARVAAPAASRAFSQTRPEQTFSPWRMIDRPLTTTKPRTLLTRPWRPSSTVRSATDVERTGRRLRDRARPARHRRMCLIAGPPNARRVPRPPPEAQVLLAPRRPCRQPEIVSRIAPDRRRLRPATAELPHPGKRSVAAVKNSPPKGKPCPLSRQNQEPRRPAQVRSAESLLA